MSHAATNWAIKQRGLKPAAKIVLWHLADCHNAHTGQCNPKQATLAYLCEMSRSTLNIHLDKLEEMGLIKRVVQVDERSRKQRPTSYFLAFDDAENTVSENQTRAPYVECAATTYCAPVSENQTRPASEKREKPCPDFGDSRVRNSDTKNPVREPGSAKPCEASICDGLELRRNLLDAIGLRGDELNTSGSFIVRGMSPAEVEMSFAAWRKSGLSDEQIIAAIRAKVASQREADRAFIPRGIKFFDGPIADHAKRLAGGAGKSTATGSDPLDSMFKKYGVA